MTRGWVIRNVQKYDMKMILLITVVSLWMLSSYAQELKTLPDMSSANVSIARAAESIVMQHIVSNPDDGISATETIVAKLLFALGGDMRDFGKKGDRVWQVHRVTFGETTSIIWVNAENKAVHIALTLPDHDTRNTATAHILEQFAATDFSSFFGEVTPTFRKDNLGGVLFKGRPGYITGGTLQAGSRGVGIAVFESHDAAIDAVEWRRKNVATIIQKGSGSKSAFSNWWFSETQALLSVVEGRIVFEAHILNKRFSEAEEELWAVSEKLLRKIAEPANSTHP